MDKPPEKNLGGNKMEYKNLNMAISHLRNGDWVSGPLSSLRADLGPNKGNPYYEEKRKDATRKISCFTEAMSFLLMHPEAIPIINEQMTNLDPSTLDEKFFTTISNYINENGHASNYPKLLESEWKDLLNSARQEKDRAEMDRREKEGK